jgi:sensor c-di-GMP phosphodiesterase-like protein
VISLHEVAVTFLRRKELLAVLIGIALAGVPMGAFNLWLNYFIEQQGQDEVTTGARRSVAMADARLARIIDSLADLAQRGIDSCRPAHLEALRQANFSTMPIKELSIIDPAGDTLCTDLGIPLGIRKVLASQPLTAEGDIAIEVISLGDRPESMVRVRRMASGEGNTLAAMAPTELFVPQITFQGGPMRSDATLSTRDGVLLVKNGVGQHDDGSDRFVATVQSDRYNLKATVSLLREQILAAYGRLHAVGTVISGVMALGIIGFALILPARRRGDPVTEIERALMAGELVPYFQPVVDITTGRLRGAEVLIRWRKPDGSLVLPGVFLPLLESSGLIMDVTRALMRRVCDEVGAAYARHPHLKISFNLAAAHFADDAIVQDVREIFEDTPIRFNQVVLEVTERQPLENLGDARRIIVALQELGVSFAIDDVGAGHSGLSYMLKLGVDIIKIDKMFIDAIGTDRNSATIIETLVDLARNLRMDIIAEGVESFEQVVFLRELGIRAAQGYVFAPALPASSFLQLIEATDPMPQAIRPAAPSAVAAESRTAA